MLGGCLYFATQKRTALVSLVRDHADFLVLFRFWTITPEMAYRGRETDFPPGSTTPATMVRASLLYEMLVVTEILKLIVGGILASYLFAFRTSRRRSSRHEVEPVDDSHHRHIDRRVGASD